MAEEARNLMRERIVDKVKKLLAFGSSPNENEAKTAMRMASELMQKHQIEMSEVLVEEERDSKAIKELYVVEGQRMKLLWIHHIAKSVAILFDGDVLDVLQQGTTRFIFVGHPEDIQMMKMMFEYLYKSWQSIVETDLKISKRRFLDKMREHFGDSMDDPEFKEAMREIAKELGKPALEWTPKMTMKFKSGHALAFAREIWARCVDLVEQRKQAVKGSGTSGTALMVMKEQRVKEAMGEVRQRKVSGSAGSAEGREMGKRAGKSIPLGGALEEKSSTGRRMLK
jgi:hypothetical protein